ncbi:MAG: 16S rRNA (guanine(966)-N(2))-methyltransferase RsmD [Bdellovibrionota bacterium]
MRITGGLWGGRTLHAPRGATTRPTSDGNRQALFNILQHSFPHELGRVVDLFAGSGSIGFEALSHGAESVIFFEKDREALKILRKNAETLGLSASVFDVVTEERIESWPALLQKRVERTGPLHTLFCDPPYDKGLAERALKNIVKIPALFDPENALIYAEVGIREKTPVLEGWVCIQRRDKGSSGQCFFERQLLT